MPCFGIAEDDDQPLRISSLQSSPAKSVIKVPLPKNAKAQSPQKFLNKRLSLLSQRSNSPMGQVSLKFNFDQRTLFEDLQFLMKTLLNQLEREKEEEDDYDVFDSGTKKSKQPVLAHFQMDVRALLNDPVRQEKLEKAQIEKQGLLQANKRLSRDLKTMKTVNLQSSTASLPGQTQSQASLGTLVGFQNMVKDAIEQDRLDELEEDRYIREGKVSLRMRKFMMHKLKQKEELERKMAQRTKKQQTQLIEMFVKKEVNFMNHYLNDSNNAINNGYKMEVITSIDSSKVKNSLRARVSRNPIVQMMRNKTIEKQQPKDGKEEVESSGHLRVNSSATTMPMTQRLSASNSTSRQALFAHQHAKNMGSPPRLSMSPSFKPPVVPKLNNLVSDSKERSSLVQEQPIFRVNNRRIMTAKGPRPSVQLK